ncbi:hypothetical protein ACP4OV_008874 [Aristida adscensionis]
MAAVGKKVAAPVMAVALVVLVLLSSESPTEAIGFWVPPDALSRDVCENSVVYTNKQYCNDTIAMRTDTEGRPPRIPGTNAEILDGWCCNSVRANKCGCEMRKALDKDNLDFNQLTCKDILHCDD